MIDGWTELLCYARGKAYGSRCKGSVLKSRNYVNGYSYLQFTYSLSATLRTAGPIRITQPCLWRLIVL
jgi:hypothetical protein